MFSIRRGIRIVVYLIAVTLILVVASRIVIPKNNQVEFGQHDPRAFGVLGERSHSLDALFLGDSEVYTSIAPLGLWHNQGIAAYDVSTSAQKLPYTRTLLKRALENQSPRVVAFETNMFFRKVSVDDVLYRALADTFPLFEYHDRWKSLNTADLFAQPRTTWMHREKGFKNNDECKPADATGYMERSDGRTQIPELNQHLIKDMVRMCAERDIEVLFLSTPSTKNWNWKRHNAVEDFIQSDETLGNVRYLDLNLEQGDIGIDWTTDSRDGGDHLNKRGARKVTAFLGSWLRATYNLPDRRNNPAYDAWN